MVRRIVCISTCELSSGYGRRSSLSGHSELRTYTTTSAEDITTPHEAAKKSEFHDAARTLVTSDDWHEVTSLYGPSASQCNA